MKTILFALAFVLLLSPAFAQYEVSVTTIDVWVKATDKTGSPVTGLKQEDFELYEDGVRVQSTCFEEVTLPQTSAPATPAPGAEAPAELPAKKFVIFLDLYNTSQPEFLYIRPKLLSFIKNVAANSREVMLAGIRADRNMGVFSPFTTDVSKIETLIQQAQANPMRDRNMDSNETDLRRILLNFTAKGGISEAVRSGYQMADSFAKQDAEVTKFSLNALARFSSYLAKQNQKEHSIVLYVSGGFSMDPGRRYFDVVDNFTESHREEIDSPELTIYHAGMNFDFRKLLEENIGKINRLNITLYTINTRGLITSDPDASKQGLTHSALDLEAVREYGDSLDVIAEETGGTSFSNSQNFKLGFTNVVQDLNHQYLVCYNAPEHQERDKYHKILLKINRPDVLVRYRSGYLD